MNAGAPLVLLLVLEPQGGNNAGFVVPDDVVASFGSGSRPRVEVTVLGHTWRTSIARMGGRFLLGVNKAQRDASGATAGESYDVAIALDDAPREVEVPEDLAAALADDAAREAAWERLSYSARKEHARQLTSAAKPETRARRLAKILEVLAE